MYGSMVTWKLGVYKEYLDGGWTLKIKEKINEINKNGRK
jgi:hypothetical protein